MDLPLEVQTYILRFACSELYDLYTYVGIRRTCKLFKEILDAHVPYPTKKGWTGAIPEPTGAFYAEQLERALEYQAPFFFMVTIKPQYFHGLDGGWFTHHWDSITRFPCHVKYGTIKPCYASFPNTLVILECHEPLNQYSCAVAERLLRRFYGRIFCIRISEQELTEHERQVVTHVINLLPNEH